MLHEQIKNTLRDAPPGYVRVFRVDSRHTSPKTWYELPNPYDDSSPPPNDWACSGWQCAAKLETIADWWPESDIERELALGGVPTIYEVHESQCHDCGTQFVFNPRAAVIVQ